MSECMTDVPRSSSQRVLFGEDLVQAAHGSRSILVAVDTTEQSLAMLDWAVRQLHQQGDVFHLVHVAKVMASTEEVASGVAQVRYRYHDKKFEEAQADIEKVKLWMNERVAGPLKDEEIAHSIHLFVEDMKADAQPVVDTIAKVAEECSATMVVIARSNKGALQKYFTGSVASGVLKLQVPVVLVP